LCVSEYFSTCSVPNSLAASSRSVTPGPTDTGPFDADAKSGASPRERSLADSRASSLVVSLTGSSHVVFVVVVFVVVVVVDCDAYHSTHLLESPAQKNNQTRTRPSSLSSHNASDIRRGEPDAVDKRRDGVI